MNPNLVTCPNCHGEKEFVGISFRNGGQWVEIDCALCEGRGEVLSYRAGYYERGRAMREKRVRELRLGLREFAELVGMLPSAYSKMEQGLMEPDETLIEKARRQPR